MVVKEFWWLRPTARPDGIAQCRKIRIDWPAFSLLQLVTAPIVW
jgi:hypothetical protein